MYIWLFEHAVSNAFVLSKTYVSFMLISAYSRRTVIGKHLFSGTYTCQWIIHVYAFVYSKGKPTVSLLQRWEIGF